MRCAPSCRGARRPSVRARRSGMWQCFGPASRSRSRRGGDAGCPADSSGGIRQPGSAPAAGCPHRPACWRATRPHDPHRQDPAGNRYRAVAVARDSGWLRSGSAPQCSPRGSGQRLPPPPAPAPCLAVRPGSWTTDAGSTPAEYVHRPAQCSPSEDCPGSPPRCSCPAHW